MFEVRTWAVCEQFHIKNIVRLHKIAIQYTNQ